MSEDNMGLAACPTDAQVREAMQTAWDDFCDDAQAYPGDIRREGRKLFFTAGTWADHTAMHLRAALTRAQPGADVVEALRTDIRNIQRNTAIYRQEARDEVGKANKRAADAESRAEAMAAANRKLLTVIEGVLATPLPSPTASPEPVAWCSPGQLANLTDVDADGGVYLPIRKTERGNFTMPLFTAAPTPEASVREAAQAVITNASRTYRARNGRDCYIQDDSGECMMLVPHEDWHALEAALTSPAAGEGGA